VQRVLDAGLLLLELGFECGADLDLRHAAGELREPLLQLLAVVVAGRVLDLAADLLDAALDVLALPAPSMMVVLSLSTSTFLAMPEVASSTVSSSTPRSFMIGFAPVRTAMSCSIALRRSP
jgi:hypothetical protein